MPRLLVEDWLPAAAIGVECMRERGSASALAPHTYLHVWWARRPLTVSRAAVLASLLPADFPRDVFERLIGFGKSSHELVQIRKMMDTGRKVEGGFNCDRAFKKGFREEDLSLMRDEVGKLFGKEIVVIDPMAGGGSIPLESARLGFTTIANEYNPVACTVLEATVDYPFTHGQELADKTRYWSKEWIRRIENRLSEYFPPWRLAKVHAYIFARTVPCPETQFATPLVPDWHLLRAKGSIPVVAVPSVDKKKGTWSVKIQEIGKGAGQTSNPPTPTYRDGKGISLFAKKQQIPSDYIKAMAQSGKMGSALYAVAVKTPQGLQFFPPESSDLAAIAAAEIQLAEVRDKWERNNILPIEKRSKGDCDRSYVYGITNWADLFSPRQLLTMGILVEELREMHQTINQQEGIELGEAIFTLLSLAFNKYSNWNAILASWNAPYGTLRSVFDRHDFSFKPTFAEMAPCNSGSGLVWAIGNVVEAYEEISKLPRYPNAKPVEIHQGSATNLPQISDKSITAVVVDPPYADNVQYSELADFFYVWLKRTQGHRRPEWFSTYLCEHDQEAVVNISRHRSKETSENKRDGTAKKEAHLFYQNLMQETFRECRRILRDDGALTVMFTHKKQEAWEALFNSLIQAGFMITATWPVKTESEHSLHQAKKNAAQSTVLLVARKRQSGAGIGYFDEAMKAEIRNQCRTTAARLQAEGLNPVDQLVGSFGPAMAVYSRYDAVRTDVGEAIGVAQAIDEASAAVSRWRVEQLSQRGLEGVEPEGQFALLCWDVLAAAEFRYNEAHLLGKAVGMDVEELVAAGLVSKTSDKIKMLSARERRRERALEAEEIEMTLFGPETKTKRRKKSEALKVHPNDPRFRTALDLCHALALRFIEAPSSAAGIGAAKGLALQQRLNKDSAVARLMEALVRAAPEAARFPEDKKSVAADFPEFRAWHTLLQPLFAIQPPLWTKAAKAAPGLFDGMEESEETEGEE